MLVTALVVLFAAIGTLNGLSTEDTSFPESWYIMTHGSDAEGCGRSPDGACSTLTYLLDQINGSQLPLVDIITDTSLSIDQQAARALSSQTKIRKYFNASESPMITMTNVVLLSDLTLTLSGLNMNMSYCQTDSMHYIVQNEPSLHQVMENPKITIHNSSFGSLDLQPGTEAIITECHIDAGTRSRPTLITAKNSAVIIRKSDFRHFVAENSPTILHGKSGSSVLIENCTFDENHGLHGVIHLHDGCTISLHHTRVSGSVAKKSGFSPLTFQSGVNATIANSVFSHNLAVMGGVVQATGHCNIRCYDSIFTANRAVQGGAIFFKYYTRIDLLKCTLEGNQALAVDSLGLEVSSAHRWRKNEGGAIKAEDAVTNIDNCTMTSNSAGWGGAVLMRGYTTIINDSGFFNNSAGHGGVLYGDGTWHVTSSTFEGNNAEGLGGCIMYGNLVKAYIRHTTFHANQGDEGGALHVRSVKEISISHCNFTKNSANKTGGAVHLLSINGPVKISHSRFSYNHAPRGGAMCIKDTKTFAFGLDDNEFHGNKAGEFGGAVFGYNQVLLNITYCMFTKNEAQMAGGAIGGQSSFTLVIDKTTFIRNSAYAAAGAIGLANNCEMRVRNSNFTANTAKQTSAGAVGLLTNVSGIFSSCNFNDNVAATGGAIGMKQSTMHMENVALYNNSANEFGGTVTTLDRVYLYMNNCSCIRNKAVQSAGCLHGYDHLHAVINNTIFTDNQAGKKGGAIDVNINSKLEIFNSKLHGNIQQSGAIAGTDAKEILIQNCHFSSHKLENYLDFVKVEIIRMANTLFSFTFDQNQASVGHFVNVPVKFWDIRLAAEKSTSSCDKTCFKDSTNSFVMESFYASVSPINCTSGCSCYYHVGNKANIINCSGEVDLGTLQLPLETTWLLADSNNVDHLCLRHNLHTIKHIDLRSCGITSICDGLFSNLISTSVAYLNFANNSITSFNKQLQNINSVKEVYVAGNPIECNCDMFWFAKWLNSTTSSGVRIVKDYRDVRCAGGEWDGIAVHTLDEKMMGCVPFPGWMIGILSGLCLFVILLIVIATIVAYRWREVKFLGFKYFGILGKEEPQKNEAEMKYDAFFCYSPSDFRWLREVFMSSTIGYQKMGRKLDLEKEDGFTLHLLERDSQVGGVTSRNVVNAIDHSKRMIMILSTNFVDYSWGMEAFMMAHDRVVKGRKDFLIIILKEKMNLDNLPPALRTYIRTYTYIDGTKDMETMRKRLRFLLPHIPLKVLRGEENVVSLQDRLHQAFRPPATTSDDTTDTGNVSDAGLARYLGGNTGSLDSLNPESVHSDDETSEKASLVVGNDEAISRENSLEYHTTGSVSHEAIEMQIMAKVHDNTSVHRNVNVDTDDINGDN